MAHTKCVTEAERYAAKGSFVGKPERNKGAQKQELWTEVLEELATRRTFDSQTRSVLERIAAQPNVPRKKPKFINFIKNTMHFNDSKAAGIWKIIEDGLAELNKRTQKPAATNGESRENGNGAADAGPAQNGSDDKSKNGNDGKPDLSAVFAHAISREGIVKETRKLLKKVQKSDKLPPVLTGKKVIKFLLSEFGLDKDRADQIWKLLAESLNEVAANGAAATNGASRKRKNSASGEAEAEPKVRKTEDGEPNGTEKEFDWQKNISRIFDKMSQNNELNLETLKSKVMKKYAKHGSGNGDGDGAGDDVTKCEKKFNKQLKKVNSLIKEDGVVRLREQVGV